MTLKFYLERDRANDQLYIGFGPAAEKRGLVRKTVRVSEDIAVDVDARGRLVGIDVMNASRALDGRAFDDEGATTATDAE